MDKVLIVKIAKEITERGNSWLLVTDITHRRNYSSHDYELNEDEMQIRYLVLTHRNNGKKTYIPYDRIVAMEEE